MLEWYFRGFADELSPLLRHISPLPEKPSYYMTQYGVNYNPEWPIRVNVDHILGDEENLSRIPADIREAQNLPLILETAVELARRKAVVEPSIVVPQGYQGRVQYLLPICLTDMERPDLAMTLTIMDGYYLGNTCLTLEMAYLNARLLSRPVAHWLTDIVETPISSTPTAPRLRALWMRIASQSWTLPRFTAVYTAGRASTFMRSIPMAIRGLPVA